MTETITRIQFSPGKVTIYSDAGVLAIWRGAAYYTFGTLVLESFKGVQRKIEETRNAVQESEATSLDVRERSRDGQEVGGGDAQKQAPPEEGQEIEEAAIAPI